MLAKPRADVVDTEPEKATHSKLLGMEVGTVESSNITELLQTNKT
jgi:hypothetical protein